MRYVVKVAAFAASFAWLAPAWRGEVRLAKKAICRRLHVDTPPPTIPHVYDKPLSTCRQLAISIISTAKNDLKIVYKYVTRNPIILHGAVPDNLLL